VVSAPSRAEELVSESQNQQVFHHLLAKVMVNPEDLVLGPVRGKGALELSGAGQIFAKRLLDLWATSILAIHPNQGGD
jgi:hypothetical protein